MSSLDDRLQLRDAGLGGGGLHDFLNVLGEEGLIRARLAVEGVGFEE